MPLNKVNLLSPLVTNSSSVTPENLQRWAYNGTDVAAITPTGILDLRHGTTGSLVSSSLNGNLGIKIGFYSNDLINVSYGFGLQGGRLVSLVDSGGAFSLRTSIGGADIVRLNNDGNISGRFIDSIANSGSYLDLGVGSTGIIAVNRNLGHTPFAVRGAASQSANLQEWQNSSSVVLSSITNAGVFAATQGISIDSSGGSISLGGTTGGVQYLNSIIFNSSNSTNPVHRILWQGGGTGNSNWEVGTNTGLQTNKNFLIRYTENSPVRDYVPLRIQGTDGTTILSAFSGQTANIQEWRDSTSTVLGSIDPDGKAYFSYSSTNTGAFGVEGNLRLRNRSATNNNYSLIEAESSGGGISSGIQFITSDHTNSYGKMIFGTRSAAGFNGTAFTIESGGGITTTLNTAANIGLVVKGAASQSGNLQEWQNSSATILAKVDSAGSITAVDLTLSGNLTVNGTTTNINTTNLVVEDKNIILGDVTTPSNTTADGGGITLKGATDKTFNWVNSTGRWTSNVGVEATSFVPNGSTVPSNGMYLPSTNTLAFSTNTTNRLTLDSLGAIKFNAALAEAVTVSATAAATTVTYDVLTNENVLYYTSNATANWTFNVRGNGSTTLNTLMDTGQSLTVVFMNTNGTTAYYPTAFQIDGSAVTPKWANGTAPSAGNASSIDVYTYNIIKTASATYTVIASQSRFA